MEQPARPWVAIVFAVVNVAAFGWEVSAGADAMQPTAQWMMAHGGNYGPLTFDGEQWRLLTSMFLHFGVIHLVMNMVGLLDGGRHVERMYGPAGFAALYIVSGLVGSLASGLRAQAVSAGASGAVFGIFGAFGAFLLLHRNRLDRETVSRQARGLMIFLAFNVWFGVTAKGIDLVAHAGGLAAGFVVGLLLEVGTDHQHSSVRRSLLVGVLGVAIVVGASLVAPKPTNALMEFAPIESKVLDRWNDLLKQAQAGTITDEALADAIENELLPAWRQAHANFARDGKGERKAALLDYMEAREEGWTTMAKGFRAHDTEMAKQGLARFTEANAIITTVKD